MGAANKKATLARLQHLSVLEEESRSIVVTGRRLLAPLPEVLPELDEDSNSYGNTEH